VRSCGATEAKATVVAVADGAVVLTASGAAVPGVAAPEAAAQHTVVVRRRTFGIRHNPMRITAIPITTPFIDITVHIMEPPGIRLFLTNRMSPTITVPIIPSHIIKITSTGISTFRPCTAGIFPFRLCRKTGCETGS
jgi:hypothetical protein